MGLARSFNNGESMKSDREQIVKIDTTFHDDAEIFATNVGGRVVIKLGGDGMRITVVSRRRGFKDRELTLSRYVLKPSGRGSLKLSKV